MPEHTGELNRVLQVTELELLSASAVSTHPRGNPAPTVPRQATDIAEYVRWIETHVGGARRSLTYRTTKRLLDGVVAGLALIILLPLFICVAIAIRIDSRGPALFVQDRVGYRGRVFRVIKFRTMVTDSGVQLEEGRPHKLRYDSRVTRVGRILRKASIDELPQLINILLGQMSLVGPRPEIADVVLAKYQPWQYHRFLVPQGLTGWWQVTGRGSKLLHEHTEDDLHYIKHASIWFDFMIMVKTIPAVLRRDGAF
jgi:lipopolysaccharide/colanic/teichoic acid biosynthesis glycosyltransferase